MTQTKNLLFFPFIAPPNGGKGTQTTILSERFQMPRLDMGSLLRQVAKEESPLGKRVQERLAAGQLVSIEIVIDVLQDGIAKIVAQNPSSAEEKQGFILDGFPRNLEQTQALLAMCEKTGAQIHSAIYLDVPDETIVSRAASRRICNHCGAIYNTHSKMPKVDGVCDECGSTEIIHRVDDHPEKVQVRLESFRNETLPILDKFEQEGLLRKVDGNRAVADITQELADLMKLALAPAAVN